MAGQPCHEAGMNASAGKTHPYLDLQANPNGQAETQDQ